MHRFFARSKQSTPTRILVKRPAIGRFLLLFAMLLGWMQSFSFLAEHRPVSDAQSVISQPALIAATPLQLREGQPTSVARLDIEREPEVEEEDEVHPDDELLADAHRPYPCADEVHYANELRTQLSQLESRLHQRAPLDFVLLFHSWKSDPC